GEVGRGCSSGRPAESTPPRPSPAPAAQGRETSPLCPSPLAAQRTRGRLGGGAFGALGRKHPSPALPCACGAREGDKPALPLPFGRAADKGEVGRGCSSGRSAESTPPRPSPAPAAQ